MEFLKNNAKWIGLAGCALMIIGCFLPFATVSMCSFKYLLEHTPWQTISTQNKNSEN